MTALIRMESARDLLPEHLINRDLSWLEYVRRLLEEAASPHNPLLERAKFLSHAAAHLDELFSCHEPAPQDRETSSAEQDASGLTCAQLHTLLSSRAHALSSDMYGLFFRDFLPELAQNGIRFYEESRLTDSQRQWLDQHFREQVYPMLSPCPLTDRSFRALRGDWLHLGVLVEGLSSGVEFFDVALPNLCPRLVEIPCAQETLLIPLEQLVARSMASLFYGKKVLSAATYRITRTHGEQASRLEIDRRADAQLISRLQTGLNLKEDEIYPIHGPIDLAGLFGQVCSLPGHEELRYPHHTSRPAPFAPDEALTDRIRQEDLLLYRPYDGVSALPRLIQQAADDPQVPVIRVALCSVPIASPLFDALTKAVSLGKQVSVLLPGDSPEAQTLASHGVQVIRTSALSSDLSLIVRREERLLRSYVCLSTGAPSEPSSGQAEHDLFTCNADLGGDAAAVFNFLSGCSDLPPLKKLIDGQRMRAFLLEKIDQEAKNALQGKKSDIFAKLNALEDRDIIAALYRASMAGVRIRMVIRDVCCLRPGLPQLSESIQVHSLVGRFQENSRIIGFENDGRHLVYLSNTDWTPAALNVQSALIFPVENPRLAGQVIAALRLQWHDNAQGRELLSNGQYAPIAHTGDQALNAQKALLSHEQF